MKKLDRDLGLLSVISIACGAMVSGLLVLPGYAANMTGPSVFLAFLVAGILFLPATFSKAEMATALPEAGGDYLFVDRSLGPVFSTISGLGMYLTLLLKSSFALAGMGAYFLLLVPLTPVYARFFAVIVGVLLVILNYAGAKKSGQFQTVLVLLTGVTLASFVLRGSIEVDQSFFKPFFEGGSLGFFSAVAFVLVSYAGVTKIASVAEEVKDPGRIIPIGMLVSLGIMVFLYVVVVYVTVGTVTAEQLSLPQYKNAPLARVAFEILGQWGEYAIATVSALALIAMANAGLMASSRYPFALSRNHQLPAFLHRIHPKFSTPSVSILLTGILLCLSILFLPVIQLAKLASAFKLIVLAFLNVALIILRESDIEWYQPEFHSPLYPYVQIIGIASSCFLIPFLGWLPAVSSLALIIGGVGWYLIYVRKRVDRQGAIFRTKADKKEKKFFREARSPRYSVKDSVIVPFFGLKGEDMLHVERRIRLASAICDRGELLDVVDFVEVPDQSFLSEFEADPEAFEELKERVELLENEIPNEIHLDQVITHNSRGALRSYAEEEKPHWVIFDWKEPSDWQMLIGQNKWWLEDFPCDLFFYKDKGRQEFKNILALTEPGPYDGEVVYAADHLADYAGGHVKFLNPHGGPDHQHTLEFVESYQEELMSMCRSKTSAEAYPVEEWQEKLSEQTKEADLLVFGGLPEDLFEDCSLTEVMSDVIEETECSLGRVQSNLRKPHSVLQKRMDVETIPEVLEGTINIDRLHASDKVELFQKISDGLSGDKEDSEAILKALWKRENEQHTYLDKGFAVPHGFLQSEAKTRVNLYLVEPGVPYGEEGEEARVCLSLIGPPDERNIQLETMSLFSELVNATDLYSFLVEKEDPTEALQELLNDLVTK